MILSFKTQWPSHMGEWAGKPTWFPEKVWQSLPDEITADVFTDYIDGFKRSGYDLDTIPMRPKKHTIREDKFDRWGHGANIHFAINSRKPNYFQFAPMVKCVSVQHIAIKPNSEILRVKIDSHFLSDQEIERLAINDGFESVEQFFTWFNSDFTGKIIHWTDLKY